MSGRSTTRSRAAGAIVPVALGGASLVGVGLLACWDVAPDWFPPRAHDRLATAPLVLVALTCIGGTLGRAYSRNALLRAGVAALAFLFWAANQLWPDARQATLFNDVAIGGFVLDVVLGIRRVESPAGAAAVGKRPPMEPAEADVV